MSKYRRSFTAVRNHLHDIRRLFALTLLAIVHSPVAAQPIREMPGFWDLRPGNEITVLVASSRRTEITVGDQPEVTTETTESLQIQYRVIAIERSGDVIFETIVRKLDRHPASPILTRLSGATFSLTVHQDGTVSTTAPRGLDALVTYLSNGDPESSEILRKSLTDDAIASWFSVPFWMIRPAADGEKQGSWDRSHTTSLGTLGTLQLDLNFQSRDLKDSMAKVVIAGEARFRPLVLPQADGAGFPFLSNTTIAVDQVTGTGQIYVTSADADEPPHMRPEFESVEWTIQLHGDAQLPSTKPTATAVALNADVKPALDQIVPAKSNTVTFRQTQHHVWTLQRFSIGMQRMFEHDRFVIPVPVQ